MFANSGDGFCQKEVDMAGGCTRRRDKKCEVF